MKKKEVLRRLSAISMAAMMTVTMIPSTAFAADEIFTDLETADTEEAVDVSDTEDTSDEATEVEEETSDTDEADISGEVEADTEESGDSEEVSAFSDDKGDAEEDALFTAGDNAPAEDAVVHMTISVEGSLATAKDDTLMAMREVTVKDLDGNGILTYDEALAAAHDEYYNGGAAAGYGSATGDYGLNVTKLWGVETSAVGYWDNDALCNSLSDPVKADDYLNAFVYKDKTKYTDVYTRFDQKEYTTMTGERLKLQQEKASFDRHNRVVFNSSNTESLLVYDSNYKPVSEDHYKISKSSGSVGGNAYYSYSLKFNDIYGTFYVVNTSEDANIVSTVSRIKVLEKTPDFQSIQIYKSKEDYEAGKEPLEITPAFDPAQTKGYTIAGQYPDYMTSFYVYGVMSENAKELGIDAEISDQWGSGTNAGGGKSGIASGDADFSKYGYLQVYLNGRYGDARYTFDVNRYATLKDLVINGLTDTAFDRDVNEYHAYADPSADGIDITATAVETGYTIKVNGTEVTSGKAYTLPYAWDADGKMKVTVEVSKDKVTPSVYTVNLEKGLTQDAPFILHQPKEADYIVGDTATALTVKASANGELSYQWYSNTTDSNEGGTAIKDATEASYTPSAETIGTVYYYCIVTNTGKTENNTTATETARVTVDPNPTPKAVITAGNELPKGYTWNKGFVYNLGDQAEALKVTATSAAEGGEFSYEWVIPDEPYDLGSMMLIRNSNFDTYVPPTDISAANDEGLYYACEVTYKFKGKTYTAWATTGDTYTDEDGKTYDVNGVYVFVKTDYAPTPEILTQPKDASYMLGDRITALSVTAQVADSYAGMDYQWYVNDKDSTEGGTAIENATWSSLNLGTAEEAGTKYYYCVVSKSIQGHTATATTDTAQIIIRDPEDMISEKLEGSGTQEDPYLIKTAEDYQAVAGLVAKGISFSGKYLRQESDITLPEKWKPIGVTKNGNSNIQNGRNLNAFSGYLDGNNKTITIPEGGKPLLGYIKEAEVHNLNIYGTKIAGYGLVNNFEGIGLSGSAIVIDNVTLKSGSSTLKSGLIGGNITSNGFAGNSAGFVATIRNCTIEKDVVVGYDKDQTMIGAIAGRMQGTVENCVSHATVYGKDYVGGIIGTRDNAMGNCKVIGCIFDGTVEASGEQAGGIVGGGYSNSTAPNGVKITINACQSSGTIIGADKVGGIIGADNFVAQAWNAYTLKGNSFTGKVQATTEGTKNIGGIIGFYDSLNKIDDIANNYYSKDCGAERGIGAVKYIDTSCTTHESAVGEVYFSTETDTSGCPTVTGCGWRAQHNRTDDPLGADLSKLVNTEGVKRYVEDMQLSGEYKKLFYLGEELNLDGLTITVTYSDGIVKEVSWKDMEIEGFDNTSKGDQNLTLKYEGATANITVKVLAAPDSDPIKVTFTLLGDAKHGNNGSSHTLDGEDLTVWAEEGTYEVDANATAYDVLLKAAEKCNFKVYDRESDYGTYVYAIEYNNVKLSEFDNGTNSGWMYTVNDVHPNVGVAKKYLEDGDAIVFHYTDDYTKEDTVPVVVKAVKRAIRALPDAESYTKEEETTVRSVKQAYDVLTEEQKAMIPEGLVAKLDAVVARMNELHEHTFDEGKVTKEPTCTEAGERLYICTVCGEEKTEEIPAAGHKFGSWKTVSKATVFAPKKEERKCSVCGKKETRNSGSKLKATVKLNVTSITLQKKQSTKAVKVTMANGDSVKSWTVGNKKIATVSKSGVIKAGTKTGATKVTVTLKSGKKAYLKVKVQAAKVKTTKISGLKSKVTLKKGQKLVLKPVLSPVTSQDKISYTSSNKKVATVSKNGTVVAKKKGTAKITVKSGTQKYTIKVTVK